MSGLKRKHVNITIQQKLDILKELEKGKSAKQLAFEYNIGCSTVHDIKKNKSKLLNFSSLVSDSLCGSENRKTMKRSPYELLDRALIHWFNNERAQGKAISGPMCVKQAKLLFNTIGLSGNFDASSGWFARFKDRYGIRSVGNSLDCIWTIGIAEPEILDGETPVLESDESGEQIEYEAMVYGDGDVLEDEFSTMQHETVEEAAHPKEHSLSDEGVTSLISQDTSYRTNDIETCLQTESTSHNESGKKTFDYEIENLKYLVEKLEDVTNKLTDLGDNYDHFGRYISSLLKGLPPKKVLYLKQKIVSDVLQSVLAYEKGVPEESLSFCNHEFDTCKSKPKTSSSKKKFCHNFSRVSFNNGTSNTKTYRGATNLCEPSKKSTKQANTKMSIDTSQDSSYFTLPCSFGTVTPPEKLQDCSGNVISDDCADLIIQRSLINTESSVNVSDSPYTYFPVVSQLSVGVSPQSLGTIRSGTINRRKKCIRQKFTRRESNQKVATVQNEQNEDIHEVTLEEPIELKKEREMDETVVWDTTPVKVKIEVPCQNEELNEILPDCSPVELINCAICPTQCASKNILVHHFTRCHPGCVPISKTLTELSSEPS